VDESERFNESIHERRCLACVGFYHHPIPSQHEQSLGRARSSHHANAPEIIPTRIRLRDLLPLVAIAQKNHFIWLKDFLDDEIAISDDLHDVLMAFRATRPA
jgi:hypothetical protein